MPSPSLEVDCSALAVWCLKDVAKDLIDGLHMFGKDVFLTA